MQLTRQPTKDSNAGIVDLPRLLADMQLWKAVMSLAMENQVSFIILIFSTGIAFFSILVDSSFHVVMDGVSLTKTGLRTVQWRPRRRAITHVPSAASTASASALDDVIDSVHAYVTRGLDDHGPGPAEGNFGCFFETIINLGFAF